MSVTENIDDILDDSQKGKYLTFTVGREEYGIEIKYVTEIIGIQQITSVPELPAYIRGIVNLRGSIIPVMDMRQRFKREPIEYNDRTCIVIVNIKNIAIGLIVDNVSEVLTLNDENIVVPPDIKTGFNNRYIKGIGKVETQIKLILDSDKLLNDEEIVSIGSNI